MLATPIRLAVGRQLILLSSIAEAMTGRPYRTEWWSMIIWAVDRTAWLSALESNGRASPSLRNQSSLTPNMLHYISNVTFRGRDEHR